MRKEKISSMLPVVFQKTREPGEPLDGFLDVMESLHSSAEEKLKNIEKYYNPYHAPDNFLPYLASWVDISRFFGDFSNANGTEDYNKLKRDHDPIPSGMGCLRELVASAARLSHWRGTSKGLIEILEVASGIKGIEISEQVLDENGMIKPFYMELLVPKKGENFKLFLKNIIELEKPVYVTYKLRFVD